MVGYRYAVLYQEKGIDYDQAQAETELRTKASFEKYIAVGLMSSAL